MSHLQPILPTLGEVGRHILDEARLSPPLHTTCVAALARPGRLFSTAPVWSRLFLAWIDAPAEYSHPAFLRAAAACECMIAGYDLIDKLYDGTSDPGAGAGLSRDLPAGVTLLLLAQDVLARLDLPAEQRARACATLSRAGRRALDGQVQDYTLRQQHAPIAPSMALTVLRHRSGVLAAACCQCAAQLAGAPWRAVGLAGRFGCALGCAAQLEDDLADRIEDQCSGRQTVPVLLAHLYPSAPDVVEITTWVLIRRFLHEAAQVLTRLPADHGGTEALWRLLPASMRAA